MQVGIPFAECEARSYPWPVRGSIRNEVFTRRGGLYFGALHLLGYTTPYTQKVHRFADSNAGWYASRNAAFQKAVALASGSTLALDGDLLDPSAPQDEPGQTERALRRLAPQLEWMTARSAVRLNRATACSSVTARCMSRCSHWLKPAPASRCHRRGFLASARAAPRSPAR
jgi:hypothetical protein